MTTELLANNTQWNFYLANVAWFRDWHRRLLAWNSCIKPQLAASRDGTRTMYAILSAITVYVCITACSIYRVFFFQLSPFHLFIRIVESHLVSLSALDDWISPREQAFVVMSYNHISIRSLVVSAVTRDRNIVAKWNLSLMGVIF